MSASRRPVRAHSTSELPCPTCPARDHNICRALDLHRQRELYEGQQTWKKGQFLYRSGASLGPILKIVSGIVAVSNAYRTGGGRFRTSSSPARSAATPKRTVITPSRAKPSPKPGSASSPEPGSRPSRQDMPISRRSSARRSSGSSTVPAGTSLCWGNSPRRRSRDHRGERYRGDDSRPGPPDRTFGFVVGPTGHRAAP